MVIEELEFYGLIGIVAAVAAVVCMVMVRRFSGQTRKTMLLTVYVTGALALGYVGMSQELLRFIGATGRPVPVSRFLTYLFTYIPIMGTIGLLADAKRRDILLGCVFVTVYTVSAVANWMLAPPLNTVGKLFFLCGLLGMLWVIFRPYTAAAATVSGERRLAFGKLRNLIALTMVMYLLVGLTSRQSLGLLGSFTGVYLGAYIDLIGHVGFAGILLRSGTAVDHLVPDGSSALSVARGKLGGPTESAASVSD